MTDKISVIIPCYNYGHLLPRTLSSLANQSCQNFEVIVVDDGSIEPVHFEDVNWPFQLKLIRTENRGLSKARNVGIEHATGKWIKFLDADDTLLPDCLILQHDSLGHSKRAISVIGFREVDEETGESHDIISGFGDLGNALLQINIGPPHIFLFPIEAIREVGGFNTGDRVNGGHEDYDLLFRLYALGCHAVSVHKIGAIYYRRFGTMATQVEPMARTRAKVWATHMLAVIRSSGATDTVMAALTGWLNLMKITPKELQPPLNRAAAELHELLKGTNFSFPQPALCAIHNLLQQNGTFLANRILEVLPIPENQNLPLGWPQQALIDWRLSLQNRSLKDSVTSWLVQSVSILRTLNRPFAIYGAGELGKNLVDMLLCTGIKPTLLIDRDAKLGEKYKGIPVVTLCCADNKIFSAVFIASHRFKNEIEQNIKAQMPQIELVELPRIEIV